MDTDTNETPKYPNRLADARIRTGATQQEAADAADLTITGYQNYEYGKRDIKGDALRKLAQFFGCSANYLLGVSDDYRKPKPSSTYRPLVGRIAAGTPMEAIEMDGDQQWVDPNVLGSHPSGFFLTVSGDSMDLRYPEGGMVYIDPDDREIENGRCYAVLLDGDDATLKQVYKVGDTVVLHPISSNPAHKDRSIDTTDMDSTFFSVVGHGDDATLKQVYKVGDTVVLHPISSNPAHKDRSIDTTDMDSTFFSVVGRVCWYVGRME